MIICCGEALIDMLPVDVGGKSAFAPHPGGAVFNTSIALGRLGVPAALTSGVSTDMFGQLLVDEADASKVHTRYLARVDRPTTLAFVRLVDGQARYAFYDENTAGRLLTAEELPALPDTCSAMFFGGISLAVEPCADTYANLLTQAPEDCVVMMDPNIRQGFIGDEATYRARLARMMARADIVKLSDEDLDWLVPGEVPIPQKAAQLQTDGPGVVVITKGADGAEALLPTGRTVSAPAAQAAVVDTVGAGDTFNAGLLAQLHEDGLLTRAALAGITDMQMTRALTKAARVAAITVSRAGANPPWAHELAEA
ncbi:fructokinase [Aliiroseovarius halocynthiae]|uniref:Carbohydrate kinase n=1 Tax=Aliiroseovarius halocynthiae TaxID=985055 RepID=A0A545SQ92_9RHOB|nr:carbohydrate kinase [Aliiroseovarius halocynthiae]TQV67127.1 carbohydrate kinase [Aliiroseovarius halocynthiae]SMR82145.1 fructokinase [Aliiroseovarius halocynthiae]